jgi:hypothetical protein
LQAGFRPVLVNPKINKDDFAYIQDQLKPIAIIDNFDMVNELLKNNNLVQTR